MIAPRAGGFRGAIERKSWDYRVTACIAHLETVEPLAVCIETLRCQTERPFILVIDTGSSPQALCELATLRAPDVEIHAVAGHSYRHASEPVALALDLAHARCHSDFLFHTHSDVFLRRREFIAELLAQCGPETPAIGYRMSPREWATDDWQGMIGHTAALLHLPTIHRAGAHWSMPRAHVVHGMPWDSGHVGWPDTEVGFNRGLAAAGIKPVFVGSDTNFERQTDANLDHVRSFPGAQLYDPAYFRKAQGWMIAAMNEARERIAAWRREA